MSAKAITATELVVEYETASGPVRALELAGLHIEAGTSLAVVGPSGSGKSTLLALLAGLATPSRGSVVVGGTTISALPEQERVRFRREEVGMIYQVDNLLPHLTLEENVALPLAIARRDGDDPVMLLRRLGIGDLTQRFPDQVSGGQRQRAAVARAIVGRPSLLLADEPTGALDDRNAEAVIELLMEAHRRGGATLVIVTHDPAVAALADRIERVERCHRARL
jgi:putative ABC transport system ATP-binding protein